MPELPAPTTDEQALEPVTVEAPPQRAKGWGDLLRDAVRPSRSQFIVALVLGVVSFGVVTQVHSRNQDQTYSTMRRSDLVQILDQLNAEQSRLSTEINAMESTRQQLASGVDAQRVAATERQKRLDALRILAGTVPATGSGVRLTIVDPQGKVGPELLLNAVEEMRDAGAEAIAVNGTVRVVASTSFTRVDGKLAVDGQVVATPITLDVIGDSHDLAEAARFRGGLVSAVQNDQVGGSVDVEQLPRLTITALHRPAEPQWARPA